jgi:hypothetical protein
MIYICSSFFGEENIVRLENALDWSVKYANKHSQKEKKLLSTKNLS